MYYKNSQNSYTNSITNKIEDKFKLIINNEIYNKVKYLCNKISEVEWSGVLLYKIKEGSIKDPKSLVIEVKDIIPMNKGSKAYTEFSFQEKKRDLSEVEDRMIDYFNDNMKALEDDWKIGLIHSHNSMGVFFSGTDMSELIDNSKSHNFYLSLIVNNFMHMTAKIGQRIGTDDIIETSYIGHDENGKKYEVKKTKVSVKHEMVNIIDADIEKPKEADVDDYFKKNVDAIIKAADEKKYSENYYTSNKYGYYPKPNDKYDLSKKNDKKKDGIPLTNYDSYYWSDDFLDTVDDSDIIIDDKLNQFIIFLLYGELPLGINDVDDALEEIALIIDEGAMNENFFVKGILENLTTAFETVYGKVIGDKEKFVSVINDTIEELSFYDDLYPYVKKITNILKQFLSKFNK